MVTAKKAVKAVQIIVILGLLSKVLGFVRELIIASYYGASGAMDAFGIANEVPGILLNGLGMAIMITFIPAFTKKVEEEGLPVALEYSRKVFTAFVLAGLILSGLGILLASPIAHILAPKFSSEKLGLAINLTRILMLSGTFMLLSALCTGLLQAREKFLIPALSGLPISLIVIFSVVFLYRRFGIYALAIGSVLSMMAQALYQFPSLHRVGFKFSPLLDLKDPEIRHLALLVLPVFTGTMLFQINTIVDRIFASGLPEGTIAAINYANRINGLLVGLVAMALSTVALPALSQAAVARDLPRLRAMMLYTVRGMNLLIIPMTVGMVVLRTPLVCLIFQRGAFDAHATSVTALALLYLSLGLFAYALSDIFSKVYYSLQDTMTPTIFSGVIIAVNVMMIILLTPRYGLAGLTGATSISGVVNAVLLIIGLKRKIGQVNGAAIALSLLKTVTASLIMGVILAFSHPYVRGLVPGSGFFSQLIVITTLTVFGALIYCGGLLLLRSEEIGIVKSIMRKS